MMLDSYGRSRHAEMPQLRMVAARPHAVGNWSVIEEMSAVRQHQDRPAKQGWWPLEVDTSRLTPEYGS